MDTDRYGRTVAAIEYLSNGKWVSLQEAQVKAGTVWAFDRFKQNCPVWNAVAAGQSQAQAQRLGLWASGNAIAPWDWRRMNR
jgi:endonuclease YncB( thermonuclease family)